MKLSRRQRNQKLYPIRGLTLTPIGSMQYKIKLHYCELSPRRTSSALLLDSSKTQRLLPSLLVKPRNLKPPYRDVCSMKCSAKFPFQRLHRNHRQNHAATRIPGNHKVFASVLQPKLNEIWFNCA